MNTLSPSAPPHRPDLRSLRTWWHLVTEAVQAWIDDRCASLGAALAYYTLFSMAPLLLIVVSVAGLLFGAEAARGEVYAQLERLIGSSGARAVEDLLASVNWPAGGLMATVGGVLIMLIGATTVVAELQSTLDHIWRAPPARGGWRSLLHARLLSFGLILGVGFLLVVSLLADAALAAAQRWWSPWFGDWLLLVQVVDWLLGYGLLTALFAMIYKIMPRVRIAWSDVWLGAGVTALLFDLGRHAIGLYIGRGAVGSGFGAAGSLVAVLTWVYYSAQIFLLGAEFTWVMAHRCGSRQGLDETSGMGRTARKSPQAATGSGRS